MFVLYLTLYTVEGAHPAYDNHGFPGSLWVDGTLSYALVVILVNVKIAYSTSTHTIWSTLIILGSIASFFICYFVENLSTLIPTLYETFQHAMTIPSFYMIVTFFVLFVLSSESLFTYTNQWYNERREQLMKEAELEELERRKSAMSAFEGRGTLKHLGFAFSQEPGHVPQITRSLTHVAIKKRNTMLYSPNIHTADEGQYETQEEIKSPD